MKESKESTTEAESADIIMFDRRLNNGFIFGVPGKGMGFIAKVDTCINFYEDADNNTFLNGGDKLEKGTEEKRTGYR